MNQVIKDLMIQAGSTGTHQVWFTRAEVEKLAKLLVKDFYESLENYHYGSTDEWDDAVRCAMSGTLERYNPNVEGEVK